MAEPASGNSEGKIKYKILLVDDESDIATIIKKGLENEGSFRVHAYNDPKKALAEFRPGLYDLALLDIRMPEINGFELYRKLKERDGRIKVCFITAFEIHYDEFRKVFPTISVTCFVRKPVSINRLAEIIQEELDRGEGVEAPAETKRLKSHR